MWDADRGARCRWKLKRREGDFDAFLKQYKVPAPIRWLLKKLVGASEKWEITVGPPAK